LASRLSQTSSERTIETFLPEFVMGAARLLLILMSYLYHCESSLINIAWIIMSVILSERLTFIVSVVVMLPILFL